MSRAAALRGPAVALDAGEYLALWRRLGLGPRHLLLDRPDHGATYPERDALDAAAWTRLAARGLVDGRDRPDPGLADALSVLAAPGREVDVRLSDAGGPSRGVVAAARGALALVAEGGRDGGVCLGPADAGDLAGSLIARVPDRRPVPGIPIVVPTDGFGPGGTVAGRAQRLRRAGLGRHTLERVVAILERPLQRVAQFGVAVRDADGRRRRGPRVVTVLDTAEGRCVVGPDPSGTRLEIRPTDRPRLRAELADLLDRHVRGPH